MSTPVPAIVALSCYSFVALELRGDIVSADHETEGHDGAKRLDEGVTVGVGICKMGRVRFR